MKKLIVISLLFFNCPIIFGQNNYNIPLTDCINTPASHNFLGWSLFYANNIYNQNNFLSSLPPSGSVNYIQSTTSNMIYDTSGMRFETANGQQLANNTGNFSYSNSSNISSVLRLGGELPVGGGSEQILKRYELTVNNSSLYFFYAAVFSGENTTGNSNMLPFFKYEIKVQYSDGTFAQLPSYLSSFITPSNTNNYIHNGNKINSNGFTIDFAEYVNFCKDPIVIISCMVSDCKQLAPPPNGYNNLNSAYAYINAHCDQGSWFALPPTNDKLCPNTLYNLIDPQLINHSGSGQYSIINMDTDSSVSLPVGTTSYSFPTPANYRVMYTIQLENGCNVTFECYFEIGDCPPSTDCIDCTSFDLELGKKYIITGWVNAMKDNGSDYEKLNVFDYDKAKIAVTFLAVGGSVIGSPLIFTTSGEIIDGWQKISGEFVMPNNIDDIKIELVNNYSSPISTFFDDIRVHPVEGNMKSFVYDQATQKLMAELDENNYATFYEYDKEGGLVRVKKETEKGINTIQETRSSTKKTGN
ncbi:MAG: hypothetical protein IM568_01875 [Flavobacterium sp.]|nr:hypothetical protein [Flavobacterium sp.]